MITKSCPNLGGQEGAFIEQSEVPYLALKAKAYFCFESSAKSGGEWEKSDALFSLAGEVGRPASK